MSGWDWRHHLQRGCYDYFEVYKTKTETFLKTTTRDGDNTLQKNSDVFHLGRTWFKINGLGRKIRTEAQPSIQSLLPESGRCGLPRPLSPDT